MSFKDTSPRHVFIFPTKGGIIKTTILLLGPCCALAMIANSFDDWLNRGAAIAAIIVPIFTVLCFLFRHWRNKRNKKKLNKLKSILFLSKESNMGMKIWSPSEENIEQLAKKFVNDEFVEPEALADSVNNIGCDFTSIKQGKNNIEHVANIIQSVFEKGVFINWMKSLQDDYPFILSWLNQHQPEKTIAIDEGMVRDLAKVALNDFVSVEQVTNALISIKLNPGMVPYGSSGFEKVTNIFLYAFEEKKFPEFVQKLGDAGLSFAIDWLKEHCPGKAPEDKAPEIDYSHSAPIRAETVEYLLEKKITLPFVQWGLKEIGVDDINGADPAGEYNAFLKALINHLSRENHLVKFMAKLSEKRAFIQSDWLDKHGDNESRINQAEEELDIEKARELRSVKCYLPENSRGPSMCKLSDAIMGARIVQDDLDALMVEFGYRSGYSSQHYASYLHYVISDLNSKGKLGSLLCYLEYRGYEFVTEFINKWKA